MKETRLSRLVVILVVAGLLAACGQAAAPSGNQSAPAVAPPASASQNSTGANSVPLATNNCSLLSKDEVGTVLAETVVEVRDPAQNGSLCVYQTQNLILEVSFIHNFGGFVDSANYMQQTRTNGVGDGPLDVPGMGDEAFYHGSSAYRILLVRKGDAVYSIGVRSVTADQSLSSPGNAQALEKSVADLLLSRVP